MVYFTFIDISISPYKIVLRDQILFHNHIYTRTTENEYFKKNGIEINLPSFYPDILMYIVIYLCIRIKLGSFPMVINSIMVQC